MYTEKQRQQVLAMFQAGKSIKEIMEETDIGRSTIYRWIEETNEHDNEEEQEEDWDDDTLLQEEEFQEEESVWDSTDPSEEDIQEDDYDEEQASHNRVSYERGTFQENPSQSHFSQNDPSQKRPISFGIVNRTRQGYDPEVEMLHLNLEHEYKMEVLRQKRKVLELEEQKLRNQEYELTIKDQQLRQQKQDLKQKVIQEAKRIEETKRKILQKIKKQVDQFQRDSKDKSWSEPELYELYKNFLLLRDKIENLANKLEENYEHWQAFASITIIIEGIEEALDEVNNNFFKSTIKLDWDPEEKEAIETLLDLDALDQPLDENDDV